MSGFDSSVLQNAQTQAQQVLETYIQDNLTDPTVGDVIDGRRTIVQEYPILHSSLPNRIVTEGARYGAIPEALQQRISYAFSLDVLGDMNDPTSFPWAHLNNAKVTLSFRPATADDEAALQALLPEGEITDIDQLPGSIPSYLISVIPELKVDGEVVKSGTAMSLGEELDFVTQVRFAHRNMLNRTYKVIAGSYLSVNVIGGSVSAQRLSDLQTRLEATKLTLESNDQAQIAALGREEILGDMFYAGTLGYYAQLQALGYLAGLGSAGRYHLMSGIGTIGYEPNVSYFFGTPRAIEPGGIVFDIPIIYNTADKAGDSNKKKQLSTQIGVISSTLEHATPEQMFAPQDPNAQQPNAISAVKALQIASSQGQRIYQITQENMATALPNIHHDQDTMDEIRASLNAGKVVMTHSDAVSVPGWSGAGYIILDPETGAGDYKITGGFNGGELDVGDLGIALGSLSGGGEAFAEEFLDDGLLASEDLPRIKLAKTISKAAGVLGVVATVIDIYNALNGLQDGTVSSYQILGRLSVLLFGFAVGQIAVAAIAATFFPIAAAIISAVFIATLSIVLADFSIIYYSYRMFNRPLYVEKLCA